MDDRLWRVVIAMTAATVLVVTGCSSSTPSAEPPATSANGTAPDPGAGGSGGTATPGARPGAGPVQDRWASTGLTVHTMLSATGDSIVYGGVEDGALRVIALDPERGTERWHRASVVGTRVRGVEQRIHTDDDTAYFLTASGGADSVSYDRSRSGSGEVSLTAVETATGKVRWSTPLGGDADPNASRCGDDVCLFVEQDDVQQLWTFDRSSGEVIGRADVDSPDGPGGDAMVAASGPGGDDYSRFIVASRGPVVVAQHSQGRAAPDWSAPAAGLFGATPVSPNGGWAGWATDDGGWTVWLGSSERPPSDPQAGDTFPLGAVAGVAPDGTGRWLRADRHMCGFVQAAVPALCDGMAVLTSAQEGTAMPAVMEGVDAMTGATTWSVALGGEIDEFDTASTVLRVDDVTYLVKLSTGSVRVDLRTGPSPSAEVDPVGWCHGESESDAIDLGGTSRDFIRSVGSYPCHLGGDAVEDPPSLPVPDFAGVHTAGYRAWVVDGTVHAQRGA